MLLDSNSQLKFPAIILTTVTNPHFNMIVYYETVDLNLDHSRKINQDKWPYHKFLVIYVMFVITI